MLTKKVGLNDPKSPRFVFVKRKSKVRELINSFKRKQRIQDQPKIKISDKHIKMINDSSY